MTKGRLFNNAKYTGAIVVMMLFATLLIGACGDEATSTSAPATTAASAATTAAGGAATTAASGAATTAAATSGPVNLVIWTEGATLGNVDTDPTGKGKYGAYLKQQFEKEHPGVTVTMENHGWDEELRQNLLTALMAGNGPDIVVGENFFQQYAELGALAPLDDVIGDVKANAVPGTYKAAEYNGKIYGLSAFTGTFGFERNCVVFKAAGQDCANPPKTWDDLLKVAQAITDKGAGSKFGYTLQGPAGFSVGAVFRIAVYLGQAGASLCNADCTYPTFNDPKGIPVYEFVRKLNKLAPPGLAFNPDESAVYSELFKGNSAMQLAGSWHVTWAKDSSCGDCQYSAIPLPDGGKPYSVIVGNVQYAVLKQSKNVDIAKQWVKFTQRDDVQDLVFPNIGRLPSTKTALTKLRPNADPATQSFIDTLLNSDLGVLPQWRKDPQKIWTAYNDMLTKVLTTDDPIKKILDDAQAQVEQLVPKS
jgi:multiple sugar transport system substrate-binding protein